MTNDYLLIGGRRVDPVTGAVHGPHGAARLEPKVLDVLLFLVARRGQVVTKADLLAEVWSEAAVSDDVVWRCVAALRRAFDDDPRQPRVIETLSRRGYRLIADVSSSEPANESGHSVPATTPANSHFAAAAVFGVIAVLGVITVGTPSAGTSADATDVADVSFSAQPTLPGSPENWGAEDLTRVGREYYERRSPADSSRAIDMFARAVRLRPDYAPAWAGLADAYAQRAGSFGGKQDATVRAVEAAERAVQLAPDAPESHKARGHALGTAGRTGEAIEAYYRALELRPGFGPATVNLGALLGVRGRYDEALALYVGLDTRGLNRVVDLHHIAVALYQMGRLDSAREYLEAALRVDPLQSDSIVLLGRIEVLTGDREAASRRVSEALIDSPADYRLRIFAGELATFDEDFALAREELWRAVEGSQDYPGVGAYVRLAWVDRQLGGERTGKVEELVAGYRDRIATVVEQQRGWAHAQLGAAVALLDDDRSTALDWLRRALDLGHIEFRWLLVDPLFGQLHEDPEFLQLVDEARTLWAARAGRIDAAIARGPLGR